MKSLAPLLCSLLLLGCTNSQLDREWEQLLDDSAEAPLRVVDYFPAPDSPGAGQSITPYFFFNRPLREGELSLSLQDMASGGVLDAAPVRDFDDMAVRFYPSTLRSSRIYEMDLQIDEGVEMADLSSRFSTALPEGTLFNMSTDLRVDSFGGNAGHADLLNALFQPGVYPLWVLNFDGVDQNTELPTVTDAAFGPAYIRSSNAHYRIYREFGFSSAFRDVLIHRDGSFEVEQEGVFLPLDNVDGIIILYLEQVRFSGRLDFTGEVARVADAEVTGVLSTRWLRRLADEGGAWRSAVNLCELNVDLNANGIRDGATFELRSEPTAFPASELDL